MTDKQIQDAADHHQAVEINKAINITNSIAKAIEAGKRAAIVQVQDFDVQVQDFDTPNYDDNYDEEGQHGPTRRF
jgi:hypothetical protein